MINHAYGHLIGTTVGIRLAGLGIVAATVMTPEPGQDDNLLLVVDGAGTWHYVLYMDTYRRDFVNAAIADVSA